MRSAIHCCIALCVLLFASLASAQTTTPEPDLPSFSSKELLTKSSDAIHRGVKFLLDHQNADGSWSNPDDSAQDIGNTALITLALLSSGEDRNGHAIDLAVKYLKKSQPYRSHYAVYSTALRACVYAQLPESSRRLELQTDLRWLENTLIQRGDRRGLYDYGEQEYLGGDYSNSQYGVLGVWYAALAGLDVPPNYWRQVENGWHAGQNDDGGFGYMPHRPTYASMTAAGVATLFITSDFLHGREYEDLNHLPTNAPLEAALNWLGGHFSVEQNIGKDYEPIGGPPPPNHLRRAMLAQTGQAGGVFLQYLLFGYERVGEISGLTRFGEHRWFEDGADFLIRSQLPDGSWAPLDPIAATSNTAYGLLFLARGRSPVIIQKLQFSGRWNNRPRDASNYTQFMRRATERHVNWQIVSIDDDLAQFRQSAMIEIASDKAVGFNANQLAKLKQYIDEGGLLVCCNEGATSEFTRSIEAMGKQMYPNYLLSNLPTDHLIYTANFPVTIPNEPIRGLSNGLRELMILYPGGDTTWKWQAANGLFSPKNSPYASLANADLYVTDRANPRLKGEDNWIDKDPDVKNDRAAAIARVRYDGNWDPEPAGWQRIANDLANKRHIDLKVSSDGNLSVATMAHLTGTAAIQLSDSMRDALRIYTSGGGLLLIDAAGGSSDAGASVDAIVSELFPTATIEPLPLDHPIYRGESFGGAPLQSVDYRRSESLAPSHIPRLKRVMQDGKLLAIVSDEDLSGGLVGYSTAGLNGYTSNSAIKLVENIVLWRMSGK